MGKKVCAVNVQLAGNGTKLPVYSTTEAAAADCYIPEAVMLAPGEIKKVPLGIRFDIPEGYCVKMYPRSSLLIKKGLMTPVSIIDSDYHGEVSAPLINLSTETITIAEGERICQIMLEEVLTMINIKRIRVARDQNGFGGTGK